MQPDVGKSGLDDRVDLLPVAVGFGHSRTLRNHPAPLKQSSSDKPFCEQGESYVAAQSGRESVMPFRSGSGRLSDQMKY
jgi:hypothetical protein